MNAETARDQDRRSGTRGIIDNMLRARQEMLVLYERVAGVKPFNPDKVSGELVRQFSQVLVDYIASGHFGLYERIVGGKERRQGVVRLAEQLYPKIATTTAKAVEFNDKLEEQERVQIDDELSKELSELGEHLATRIELEDQIIAQMLSKS